MLEELFDTSKYISTASVDNTTPPNPVAQKKEVKIAAENSIINTPHQPDITAPWAKSTNTIHDVINDFIAGKASADKLMTTFNSAANTVVTAIDEIRGRIFLTILYRTENHLANVSYGKFVNGNTERAKFIGKSDYYALRNYYDRYHQLSDALKEYISASTLTNAKCALNMPDYSAEKLAYIQESYPNGVPSKKEFAKLLLPPPTPKVEKPKGKPRNMSVVNMQQLNAKFRNFAIRAIKSLRETHNCNDDIIHELQCKYDEFNSGFTAILADLQQSAKRTITAKSRKEEALI